MINITLKDFQEEASLSLLNMTTLSSSKQSIVVKAPTGTGKTIILIDFIDKYLSLANPNTVFIWLCPGKGDLEEQSKMKMQSLLPSRQTNDLFDSLLDGFQIGTTSFINWELITKSKNKAISYTEKKNLFDRIAEAHREDTNFILIIDEEQSNDTKKADSIIDAFSASHIIRVSATAKKRSNAEWYSVDELDVINSGLITKALSINEDVNYTGDIIGEHEYLIDLAEKKRKQVYQAYKDINSNINPLVVIQFPSNSADLIKSVESKLASMGYTYQNQYVAKWMAEEKKNTDGLVARDAKPIFLLMKQAIATGWDCPRAKILIKLRENMSEDFEIQTLGRLRRMPEAKHYDKDILDFCYLYTFDEKYKEAVKSAIDDSFETQRVYLKDKCKTFTLTKENRDLDNYVGTGKREIFRRIRAYLVDKYKLTNDFSQNYLSFKANQYIMGESIKSQMFQGEIIKTDDLVENNPDNIKTIWRTVNTHHNGIEILHSYDELKKVISITSQQTKTILERLFRKGRGKNKILSLDTQEYYAFIINNTHQLKMELREVISQLAEQQKFNMPLIKTEGFTIPLEELYRFDSNKKDAVELLSNAYKGYTSAMLSSSILKGRSKGERLFEKYCDKDESIDWVYKNGDKGQQYFSIVYENYLGNKQWLFYPDYIVQQQNSKIWLIEIKGGEVGNESDNFDKLAKIKFEALKRYVQKYTEIKNDSMLNWGFVREKDEELKFNNTEFTESMYSWIALERIF